MIISRTPMRISLAGGGTDLPVYYRTGFGSVCNTAIDRYTYITVNKKFDDLIRVSYWKTEIVETVDQLEHNIIREALKVVGIERGVEVVYMGDIPLGSAGTGLGSSSSLAVGVLNALHAYKGEFASAGQLAEEACEIEINRLRNPIGKQDQYAAAFGGFNHMRFNADESVYVDPLICKCDTKKKLCDKLMLFHTGIDRISSHILSEQKSNINGNAKYLDEMVTLSDTMKACIQKNDYHSVGELLHVGWRYKRRLASKVTNPQIDAYYQAAREAGAVGGKISGAGGGGFLLLYVEEPCQQNVRRALGELKEMEFNFESQGSKIIYISE